MQKYTEINLSEVSEVGVKARTVFYITNIRHTQPITSTSITIATSDKCVSSEINFNDPLKLKFTIRYTYLPSGEPYAQGDYWFIVACRDHITSFDILPGPTGDETSSSESLNIEYRRQFKTPEFNFSKTSPIDIELQPSYDGSMNVIFTDDVNPMRVINSKFSVEEGGETAKLIKRRTLGATNVYDSAYFHKTTLIPTFKGVPSLSLDGVTSGGNLLGGGYVYFFKYADADGLETGLIEESRPVVVTSNSGAACKPNEITNKTVKFKLVNCDKAFPYVRVYYSIYSGTIEPTPVTYMIDKNYNIQDDGTCYISHTGYELAALVDISTVVTRYNVINNCKSLAIVNNRLTLGNVTSKTPVLDYFERAALNIVPEFIRRSDNFSWKEDVSSTALSPYTDPKVVYNYTGYHPDEAYEFGIVGITDQGYTAVYPIHGYHQNGKQIKDGLVGIKFQGFDPSTFQNAKGVFRFPDKPLTPEDTKNNAAFYEYINFNLSVKYTPLAIDFDVTNFKKVLLETKNSVVKGFFFVRKHRKPNRIMHGLSGKTVPVPIESFPGGEAGADPATPAGRIHTQSNVVGVYQGQFNTPVKLLPFFNNLWPYGHEDINGYRVSHVLRAPQANYKDIGKYYNDSWRAEAFISPDMECDANTLSVKLDNVPYFISKQEELYSKVRESNPDSIKSSTTAVCRIPDRLIANKAMPIQHNENKVVEALTTYVPADTEGFTDNSFASRTDRNIFNWNNEWVSNARTSGVEQKNMIRNVALENNGDNGTYPMQHYGGTSVKYSGYVGLRYIDDLTIDAKESNCVYKTSVSEPINKNINFQCTQWDQLDDFEVGYSYLGTLDYIQQLKSDDPLWINKYSAEDQNEYFPISSRISIATIQDIEALPSSTSTVKNTITLYGGDCYIGTMHKQLWHPLGIAEAPQATDIATYRIARRSLAMLNYGMAITFPTISSYNFHIRMPEIKDVAETIVFGKRSFLPNKGFDKVRGNVQLETTAFNMGYADHKIFRNNTYFSLDSASPFYAEEYPNRVFASNLHSSSLYKNGFRELLGTSFKDYSPDLGAITKLMSLKSMLIVVFQSGVGFAGVDERGVINVEGGETAFIANANVLSPKTKVLSDMYGSTQFKSVCASANYIYGVDTVKKAAWRTAGQALEVISTFKTQSWFVDTERKFLNHIIIGTPGTTVKIKSKNLELITTYDDTSFLITYTYKCTYDYTETDNSTSIVYKKSTYLNDTISFNEVRNVWESKLDYHPSGFFNLRGNYYSFGHADIKNALVQHGQEDLLSNYNDVQYPTEFEIVISDDNTTQKILNHLQIVSNRCTPEIFTYTVSEKLFNNKTSYSTLDEVSERHIKPLTSKYSVSFQYSQTDCKISLLSKSIPYVGEKLTFRNERIKVTGVTKDTQQYRITFITLYPELDTQGNMNSNLFYKGHRISNRMSSAEYEENKWEIQVPKGKGESRIRDKWIKVKITYNGNDPLFVTGIMADINYSFA